MKETIKISIGGLAFTFDIDAYDRLSFYLNNLKEIYESKEDGNEIISDIEYRISELLQIQTGNKDESINLENIDYIIGIVGNPSDFYADDERDSKTYSDKSREAENKKVKKKLYRDLDNKIIGGVCSGLGQYIKTDPFLIRIIALILVFCGNIFIHKLSLYTILFYLILWAIVPAAKSIQQKIDMHNKGYSFDEFEQRKSRKQELRGTTLGRILLTILKTSCSIILFIIGLSILIIPIIWIYFSYIFSIPSIGNIAETLGLSSWNTNTSLLFISVIPAILIISIGIRLLTKFKKVDFTIMGIGLLIWIASLTFFSKEGTNKLKEYKVKAEYNKEFDIDQKYDTLYINIDKLYNDANPFFPYTNIYIMSDEPFSWFLLPKIKIIKDKNFKDLKISITNYAWARNYNQAKGIAQKENNTINLNDSILRLEPHLFTKRNNFDRIFSEITIYTPINKEVKLDETIKEWIEIDKDPNNKKYKDRYAFSYSF